MPIAALSSSSWIGAPPVSEGSFSFTNGVLFATTSGQHQHRRATTEELGTHFRSGQERDHPAHWFEAQLIHYGLPPSKTKSVARMRLFDAVQAGGLSVPSHLAQLEERLKKDWTKQDRAAKKTTPAAQATLPAEKKQQKQKKQPEASAKASGMKRKADVIVNVTVNQTVSSGASQAAKKAKTPASNSRSNKSKTKSKPKAASEKPPCPNKSTGSAHPPRVKQTARRGPISQDPGRQASAASRSSPAPAARPKQTARRGGALAARGRLQPVELQYAYGLIGDDDDGPDDCPPPYSEHADQDDDHGDDEDSLTPMGLLNGRYDISSDDVDSQWPQYDSDFDLVLTLADTSLWGGFNLGVVSGVMYFEQRPWQSSHEAVPFQWRGREDQGPILYGNEGWMRFLGGGRIEGWLDHMSLSFSGRRFPGQGTRSETSVWSLQNEWDDCSEEHYEQERVGRW